MAQPRYLVVMPPGAPVPDVGFVQPGAIFTAPDGYLPSKTFKPVNVEAQAVMKDLFKRDFPLAEIPKEEPKVEQAMTLADLDTQSRGKPADKKRAADR